MFNFKDFDAQFPNFMKHIGYLEEYWTIYVGTKSGEHYSTYAGHRAVQTPPQPCGSEHRLTIKLTEDIEINRSFSKKRILKSGTLVRRMVSPMEGK